MPIYADRGHKVGDPGVKKKRQEASFQNSRSSSSIKEPPPILSHSPVTSQKEPSQKIPSIPAPGP
ncbi:hypothetical protein PILCRDRAFT_830522, partial [Piloderma croceum F 1598]